MTSRRIELTLYASMSMVILFLVACASNRSVDSWTVGDKAEAGHFVATIKATLAATDTLNVRGKAFTVLPDDAVQHALRLYKVALAESRQVSDRVLEKALPGLSAPFHALLQRSLELEIENLEKGDANAEMQGLTLSDQWGAWYDSHRTSIRIPQ